MKKFLLSTLLFATLLFGGIYNKSLEYLKILKHDVKAAYDKDIEREEVKKHVRDSAFKGINYYDQLNHSNINHYYDQPEWAE